MSLVEELFTDSGTVVADDTPSTTLALDMPKAALRSLIADANAIIPTRDAMPILKYVKLHATKMGVTATATDMELTLISAERVAIVDVPGTVVLPVAKVLGILRSAADADVRIRATASRCRLTIGTTTWTLAIPSGADFPAPPVIHTDAVTVTVGAQRFLDALNTVKYAATDASRPGLSAVQVHNTVATGCDGGRFAQTHLGGWEFPEPLVLPLPAVERLLRLSIASYAKELDITVLDRHYVIAADGTTFIVTKSLHPYPDLTVTLLRPALANRHPLTVDLADFGEALTRTRVTADPDIRGVALHLTPGRLTVESRDTGGNSTSDEIACTWAGPTRTLTVHHRHLCDMFFSVAELIDSRCGADRVITLLLGDDTKTRRSPILARDEYTGTVSVIQQMYLDWSNS